VNELPSASLGEVGPQSRQVVSKFLLQVHRSIWDFQSKLSLWATSCLRSQGSVLVLFFSSLLRSQELYMTSKFRVFVFPPCDVHTMAIRLFCSSGGVQSLLPSPQNLSWGHPKQVKQFGISSSPCREQPCDWHYFGYIRRVVVSYTDFEPTLSQSPSIPAVTSCSSIDLKSKKLRVPIRTALQTHRWTPTSGFVARQVSLTSPNATQISSLIVIDIDSCQVDPLLDVPYDSDGSADAAYCDRIVTSGAWQRLFFVHATR
jgi:hypothetical protein